MLSTILFPLALLAGTTEPPVITCPPPRQDVIRFVEVEPGRLKVKVVRVHAGLKGHEIALAQLEVSNPTDVWAEPLEFTFKLKGKVKGGAVAPRVASPFGDRAGRAIPPQSSSEYWVNVTSGPKSVAKTGARVTAASFFERPASAAVPEDAPVTIGKLEVAEPEVDFQGNRLPFQHVRLTNTSDRRVELIFRADFKNPFRGPNLVHCTLEPKQTRDWTIEGATLNVPGSAHFRGSELSGLKLIDRSELFENDEEPAKERLRSAYDARAAWPSPDFCYSGRYKVLIERFNWDKNARERVVEEGSFSSKGQFANFVPDAAGKAKPPGARGGVPVAEGAGWILLNHANRELARESFDTWLDGARVVRHREADGLEVVSVLRKGNSGVTPEFYWLEDGEIVAEAATPRAAFLAPRWFELEEFDGGTVVHLDRERHVRQDVPAFPTIREFEYAEVDGIPIPSKLRKELHVNPAEKSTTVTVEISDISLDGEEAAPVRKRAPTGELADQVRAAWDRGYRHPSKTITLSGSFTVKNPGNDALWRGHRLVTGTFRLVDFNGSGWGDWEVALQGDYTEEVAEALRGVVIDRFGMFLGRRDFAGRKSFDEAFAGARLKRVGSRIVVKGSPIELLQLRHGRVTMHMARGMRYDHTWKKIGDAEVVVRFEAKPESMQYKRVLLGEWWLTADVTMKNVFEGWGPESVEWRDLVIE